MPTGPLSLRLILVVAGAVTTLGIMLLITWSAEQLSSRSLTEQIGRTMEVLPDQVQDKIDRTLVVRARDLKTVAELIKGDPVLDSNAANAVAKKQLLSNPAFEWLGILNRDMGGRWCRRRSEPCLICNPLTVGQRFSFRDRRHCPAISSTALLEQQ